MTEPSIYEIKKITNWTTVIPACIWTILSTGLLSFLIFNMTLSGRWETEFILILLPFLLFTVYLIRYVLWEIRGTEVISLSEQGIDIENKGIFFADHTHISYAEMDLVDHDDDPEPAFISRRYRISGGRIKFHYLGRIRRVGQDIAQDQAEGLAAALREEMIQRRAQTTD